MNLYIIGNGRVEVNCFDGNKRMCTIRGKLKNRVWINPVSDLFKSNLLSG